jgi:hypothetical protein
MRARFYTFRAMALPIPGTDISRSTATVTAVMDIPSPRHITATAMAMIIPATTMRDTIPNTSGIATPAATTVTATNNQ